MKKLTARLLLAAALALPAALPATAQSFDPDKMTTEERDAFGRAVRSYLLDNPEVIFEAIQILEQKRNAAKAQADGQLIADNAKAIYDDGFSWVGGNPDGDVTIVEFTDYRCGYCKRSHPVVRGLLKDDQNIRLIVKEFPILGSDSVAAGRMALAALDVDPSLYGKLNDELMRFKGQLTDDIAYRIAGQIGYDTDKLKERAESDEIAKRVKTTYGLADRLGIQGTPGFVIGNQIIRGYVDRDALSAAIADARTASN